MKHPTASLLCDRCGRSMADRPDGGFRFCPGCSLYVCPQCWSIVANQCQTCARPTLAPSDHPTSRTIRDTIAPPLIGNPRLTDPQPANVRPLAASSVRRAATAPEVRTRIPGGVSGSRARSIGLSVVRRLLMAASLAVAGMAVAFAVDLSLDPSVAPSSAPRTMEGTLSGTPPATATAATPAPTTLTTVTHTVARGETLVGLAARYYGDESRWREILRANMAQIPDPDNLRIGTVLVIPPR